MHRPAIEFANHTEVYEYYGSLEINQLVTRGMHRAAALLYHPRVTYAPEAEATLQRYLGEGVPAILTSNHINMFDQLPIAAHMINSDVLRPMVGNTLAWAKKEYLENPLLRPWLDAVGAMPVWRGKDMPQSMTHDTRLEAIATQHQLFDTTAQRMADGAHLFVFPESTRNQGDLTRLGTIHSGVGRVAVLAAERIRDQEHHNWAKVQVVPTALWYGADKPRGTLRPYMYVHKPFLVQPNTMHGVVTARLETAMAYSLEHARAFSTHDSLR
jgi:1-acyl-sn-glycerol-3-phosphate acyltransferase